MNKLIKSYNVQPNEKQRDAMTRAFKNQAVYELGLGNEVSITTSDAFGDTSLLATLRVNGTIAHSLKIGIRGGLIVI